MTQGEPTDEAIAELLRDPECPTARVLGSKGERIVQVTDFIACARSRGIATTHLEQSTDAYVERIGGRKDHVLDPWSPVPNLIRRITRRPSSAPEYFWAIPDRSNGPP